MRALTYHGLHDVKVDTVPDPELKASDDLILRVTATATGQTLAQRYMPQLLKHIQAGELKPDIIITHRMKLAEATEGYRIFNKKEEDCRKVVLTR